MRETMRDPTPTSQTTITTAPPASTPPPISPSIRLLLINPNSTVGMTDALRSAVSSLNMPQLATTFFTAPPPSAPSLNTPADTALSAQICLPLLRPLIPSHDVFLVACYSAHPLVGMLRKEILKLGKGGGGEAGREKKRYVTGIFEASVLTCLGVVGNDTYKEADVEDGGEGEEKEEGEQEGTTNEAFGIITTSPVMGAAIQEATEKFLGLSSSSSSSSSGSNAELLRRRFAGVATTGLNAGELHGLPIEVVREKMKGATRRLLTMGDGGGGGGGGGGGWKVGAICLGCAGMAGLEGAVREACGEVYGEGEGGGGERVRIVDGVRVGVGLLVAWGSAGM